MSKPYPRIIAICDKCKTGFPYNPDNLFSYKIKDPYYPYQPPNKIVSICNNCRKVLKL